MAITILKSRFADSKIAINTKYQINEFLAARGIHLQSNRQICCPFHDDSTPSFSVNFETNEWKCFGCQNGGHFLDLWKTYQNKYEEGHYSIYSATEALLSSDTELQQELGFKSIYKTEEDEFNLFATKDNQFRIDDILSQKITLKHIDTDSMKQVLEVLKYEPPDVLVQFICDCQAGFTEMQLIRKYYKKDVDISECLSPIGTGDTEAALTEAFMEALQ